MIYFTSNGQNLGFRYPITYTSNNGRKELPNNTIKVKGEGMVTVKPNQALIFLGVVTEDKNVQKAQQQNAVISNRIIEKLNKIGIEQIETTTYTINPVYDFDNGERKLRGYEVKHMFKITGNNISKVGEAVDVAAKSGSNIIDRIEFTVSNTDFYYKEALKKATMNAQRKAEEIAKTLGVEIISVPLWIVEESAVKQPQLFSPRFGEARATTPIQEGEIKFISSVKALFQYGKLL